MGGAIAGIFLHFNKGAQLALKKFEDEENDEDKKEKSSGLLEPVTDLNTSRNASNNQTGE